MKKHYNYTLGLDLGVGSVGWSCVLNDDEGNPYRILDLGSRIFESEGASMEDRRVARGLRRVLRRRRGRVNKTKQIFIQHHYLTQEKVKSLFDVKGEAKRNPYALKIKGKAEALTLEELCIVLVHYSKGRGFKSNRKVLESASESKSASEEQKLLFAKQQTEHYLKEKQVENPLYTITDLLMEEFLKNGRIRNTSGNYQVGITRAMIEQEVVHILNKQIDLGVIEASFKDEYLQILLHQRLFSEGPDEPSPYHNPLQQMIGTCRFTHESRAAKTSVSYELFTLVQKLRDIRFYELDDNQKQKLNTSEIEACVELALNNKAITYKVIQNLLKRKVKFTGLMLPKKKYFEVLDRLKVNPELDKLEELQKEKDKIEIYKLEKYSSLKNKLEKVLGKDYSLRLEQYDLIADCLTRCKSDIEIENYLNGKREVLKEIDLTTEVKEFVKQLDDQGYSAFGKVSYRFLNEVLPLMIHEGKDYAEACSALGYNHSNQINNTEDFDEVPVIDSILEQLEQTINNKTVIRTLIESRKVVNAVINEYGKPLSIHIEMARELTKSADERKDIQNQQFANQTSNMAMKYQIYSKHADKFRGIESITGQDLIEYKLYIEQQGICPYTLLKTGDENLARIDEKLLFTSYVEIDHIIPYSICFDDRMENKVLVKKQENQEKSNRTPLQFYGNAIGKGKYVAWVNRNTAISEEKQSRYLADKVTDQLLNDYRARTLNDTRYAAKAFKQILNYSFPSIKIKSFTGQITAKLRNVYRLNGLTHSYEAKDYKKKNESSPELDVLYQELNEMILNGVPRRSKEYYAQQSKIQKLINENSVKNRENHLHHALDATILAIANDKTRRKVEMHEMALRQKKLNEISFKIPVFDADTGELIRFEEEVMSIEEYRARLKHNESIEKAIFPEPYPYFKDEVIYRVYELEKDRLHEQLSGLPQYLNVNLEEIEPIFVSHHTSSKASGRMHKATFYGVKEVEDKKILTGRMAINSDKFDLKKLDTIYDSEGTQSYIYSAVKEWLEGYPNGQKAYEGHNKKFPKNRNGNEIKKVKLDVGELKEEFQIQKDIKQYVEKEDVVQVRVYQRENDDKLYFVGIDRFRLMNESKRDDLSLLLWTGQGKNYITLKISELSSQGFVEKPLILIKGQTILVEKRDGTQGLAKVVGFGSGMFEVESIIGDGRDLIYVKIFENFRKQYQLTVSTIKSIRPISVSILGKIKSNR